MTFQGIMSGGKPSAMALLSEDLYGGVSVDLGLQSAAIKGHNATNSIVQQYYHTSSQYQNDLSLNQVPALERLRHNLKMMNAKLNQQRFWHCQENMLYSFYKRYNESAMWCLNPSQMCNNKQPFFRPASLNRFCRSTTITWLCLVEFQPASS